jgi:hypothetical protein
LKLNRNGIISIALLAILVFPIAFIEIPNASAATYTSYPFIGAMPNPVGVGQQVLLHVGMLTALTNVVDGWLGLKVEVVRPDNTTTLLDCPKTDSTGGTGVVFVPNQVGNYTLTTIFPEQNATSYGVFTNNLYYAARSDSIQLVVQEEPVEFYPAFAMPTEYWSRPIDAQIREWYSIAGHWLRAPEGFYTPFNDAPSTAHILWQRPLGEDQGGLVGGMALDETRYMPSGTDSFENGDAYEGRWPVQFIIAGILYYCPYETGILDQPVVAIDLHTGKELWTKTFMGNTSFGIANLRPSFTQIIDWKCFNNDGVFMYLGFSSTAGTGNTVLSFYDAYSGNWRYNITNVPGGTTAYGALGEQLRYGISNVGNSTNRIWNMTQWNNTYVVSAGKEGMSASWGSQVRSVVYNSTTRPNHGYDLNVTLPELQGSSNPSILKIFPNNRIIGGSVTSTRVHLWGLNLNESKGAIGTLLFNNTWTPPSEWVTGNITVSGFSGGWCAWGEKDNVAVLFGKENRVHYGFSLENGNFLWDTAPENYLNAWDDSLSVARMIANGKFYSTSISGIVNCYDVKDGKLLWTYSAEDPYTEEQFSNNWWLRPMFVTNDYAYFGHLEHSANNPRPRGAPFICLNVTSGEVVWRIDGAFRQSRWGGRAIMGDSIIATQDTYNQQVYAIGKGPSKLTVTAPNIGVPQGTSVMISGTVTDVSPGTNDDAIKMRFPNGVPAMSDASQSDWMLYVYKQFTMPASATGVDVQISVVDSNGNFRNIGTATTDISGTYNLHWTPDIPGKYTVIATFAGSGAYYASYSQAALGVDAPAVTPAPSPTPDTTTAADLYLLPGIAAIIVAIAVVGAILALLVTKKRP